jgi:hypothetical protein
VEYPTGRLARPRRGLHAQHITGQVFRRGGDDLLKPARTREESIIKPIPFIHPRTGKPILYTSQQMTERIVELPPDESELLLEALFAHLYGSGMVYEHHCFASFGEDRAALLLLEAFGLQDCLMWANDYPHHEGSWPHSAEAIERTFPDGLSEITRAKLLGLNAARAFRFEVPET